MILSGRGLVQQFGERVVVNQLDLDVDAGEVVGLLGPNGAGKSTMFQLLAGLQRPKSGTVRLKDVEVTRQPLYQRARMGLGYLPQGPSVFPRMSVRENVALGSRGASRDVVEALLEHEDLGALAERRAGSLSGGERRRVELARVLLAQPAVVLLDEPFAGVDPIHVQAFRQRIRALAAAGTGVLLTDHAVGQALWVCDRCTVIDQGVARVSGKPRDVAANPWVRESYLGSQFPVRALFR